METPTSANRRTIGYNPDVLDCLANLSNDEVFTSPRVANQMLDMLPQELFSSPYTTFLDPVSKSGVFLREIVKRLMVGLESLIPDRQERLDHIFTHQVYGIAITNLTALISRRSVYCSKKANSQRYSYCKAFGSNVDGLIRFREIEHFFEEGKCKYCGASESVFGRQVRGAELESHAYEFIHTDKPENIYPNVKFDVIIGNPPYQLDTAGDDNGAQAKPLYHLFVQQAKKMNPRFLSMIIPSRWFAGGWGLDDFRAEMIADKRVRILHDYFNSSDCFQGVDIKGGVCYFLWDRDNEGPCKLYSHLSDNIEIADRFLLEPDCDILIRSSKALPILHKIRSFNEKTFDSIVSTKKPFGMTTNYHGQKAPFQGCVKLYANKRIEYVSIAEVTRNNNAINKHKLIVPKAVGSGDNKTDVIKPLYCEPNSVCTETYLLIGPFNSKEECENVKTYVATRFFHFLVGIQKNTQDCMKKVYSFVPILDFSHAWTDEELFNRYQLTPDEIEYIKSTIHPEE